MPVVGLEKIKKKIADVISITTLVDKRIFDENWPRNSRSMLATVFICLAFFMAFELEQNF